jgi:hypothetical protein
MIVKLVDAPTFPVHGEVGNFPRPDQKNWDDWRGRRIEIFAAPRKPNSNWTCGTKGVWLVRLSYSQGIIGLVLPVFVCEHQIQFIPQSIWDEADHRDHDQQRKLAWSQLSDTKDCVVGL